MEELTCFLSIAQTYLSLKEEPNDLPEPGLGGSSNSMKPCLLNVNFPEKDTAPVILVSTHKQSDQGRVLFVLRSKFS